MISFKLDLQGLDKTPTRSRPQSARGHSENKRNPILLNEEPEVTQRSVRSKVPRYMESER